MGITLSSVDGIAILMELKIVIDLEQPEELRKRFKSEEAMAAAKRNWLLVHLKSSIQSNILKEWVTNLTKTIQTLSPKKTYKT